MKKNYLPALVAAVVASQTCVRLAASGNWAEDRDKILNARLKLRPAAQVEVNGVTMDLSRPPAGLVVRRDLGVLTTPAVQGQVIHKKGEIVWVPRATITPKGDYLVLFPYRRGAWYQGKEMLAVRSTDKGRTWSDATVVFDASQSHHGFVPLIPRCSKRIYAFGTQAIPGMVGDRKLGLHENAPIGFRYSDDDGHTWSPVEIIKPANDPEFRGMSCVRMCETLAGTWLIGSHDGVWSIPRNPEHPVATRQYVLRSDDRGKTWTIAPGARPNGWFVRQFDRMDEGTVLALAGGDVVMFVRTAEGHIWETRSTDDGKTWTQPKPTPLVHSDAPPMVFHLADGRTLIALIHNRHDPRSPHFKIADRNEIWAVLSKDGGRTWSEPRFVFAGILEGGLAPFHSCSYVDLFADGQDLHLFLGQAGSQLLHLTFHESDLAGFPTKAELQESATGDKISKEITVGGMKVFPASPPRGLVLREELGLVTAEAVDGQIVHRAAPGKDLYETRGTITPGGDFLLMFPEGRHYGRSKGARVNDVKQFDRMDEGRPISLGGGKVFAMFRTPEGHLWSARSEDDGKTWTDPAPTPLVHPDAPPMLFLLADGQTLVAFHHNRHAKSRYAGLTANMEGQKDRSELWVSTSTDEGRTWSEPRFVLANALAPKKDIAWYDYQCSYADLIVDGEDLHLFLPHRWERVLHLRLKASDLPTLPTRPELRRWPGPIAPRR